MTLKRSRAHGVNLTPIQKLAPFLCVFSYNVFLLDQRFPTCGTITNTGWKNGVIRSIELKIQRPLQWFICLLHFKELPFKYLFEYLDGETTGPASFSGKMGKHLTNCEKLPILNFEATELVEININKTDLSKDQQYLLDIVRAIQTGKCAQDMAVRDPGPLSHSRWLTCAIRVLR
ncbi:hypothetical protein AVEN_191065-1 [Araneus ventricosus]|uniref:Uncharacterized protein n=1 Tax=Araneus ventricosus TaxID=182803 RepID=A0A4Y2AZH2_ARAVE|nr:hypothetical protein AVEN_191065-1 [Araneus ventricosus]